MLNKTVSGTLLIAGTTIGAGMLGIPLVTAGAGFSAAVFVTALVWSFMFATGMLYLEAILWMQEGANILSLSGRFLGKSGKLFAGLTYLFMYYCLMIAYFAAGAPILGKALGLDAMTGLIGYGVIFGGIVALGLRVINRVNYYLMIAMIFSYLILVGVGLPEIEVERLIPTDFSKAIFAAPILFSAFGFHNVIPSLVHYFDRNVKVLRRSIFWGTFIPFAIYLVWQALVIGVVPKQAIEQALAEGRPATAALQALVGFSLVVRAGQFFAFFAIITSMLGVAFSLVDFLADGMGVKAVERRRAVLCLLVFLPPFVVAAWDPTIFVSALGIAGGFGEAFLNGLLPVMIVWIGRYRKGLHGNEQLKGNKPGLIGLFLVSVSVMMIEMLFLLQ